MMNTDQKSLGVFTASKNGVLQVFDLETGTLLAVNRVSHGNIHHMAVSEEGSQMVLATEAGAIATWNLKPDQPPGLPRFWAGPILALEARPSSCWVWANEAGFVNSTGRATWPSLKMGSEGVESLAFSPGGGFAVWTTRGEELCVRDGDQNQFYRQSLPSDLEQPIRCLGITPEGDQIVFGHRRSVSIYSVERHPPERLELQLRLSQNLPGGVNLLTISRDGTRMLTGNSMGTVVLWDLEAARELQRWSYNSLQCFAVTPDGNSAVIRYETALLDFQDLISGNLIWRNAIGQGKLSAIYVRPLPTHLREFKNSPAFSWLNEFAEISPSALDHLMWDIGAPSTIGFSKDRAHLNRCRDFLSWAQSPQGCGLERLPQLLSASKAAKTLSTRSSDTGPRDFDFPPRDEQEVIYRDTDVEFPSKVEIGKPYPLRIQFVLPGLKKAHAHDETIEIPVPPTAPGQAPPTIKVRVTVFALGFQIEGTNPAEVTVPWDKPSDPLVLFLMGDEPGTGRITVDFHQEGQYLGSVRLEPEIQAKPDPSNHPPVAARPIRGSVALQDPASPGPNADLRITVGEHRHGTPYGTLWFMVDSDRDDLADLEVAGGDMGFQLLRRDMNEWVESELKTLSDLAANRDISEEDCQRKLTNIGNRFFDQLLPAGLQQLALELAEDNRGVQSLAILSDEPHIPWELIKPHDAVLKKQYRFWGEQFQITRWLRGKPGPRLFPLMRSCAMIAKDIALSKPLSKTKNEWDGLQTLVQKRGGPGVKVLDANRENLEATFTMGFDWLHVGTHGILSMKNADRSALVLEEDDQFFASDLDDDFIQTANRPFVFLNSCRSGRLGYSLTKMSSWGARLTQDMNCGGFLGTLWDVTKQGAVLFADAFYQALDTSVSISEATWKARAEVREAYQNDPSWLAFCCFAHPSARLTDPQTSP